MTPEELAEVEALVKRNLNDVTQSMGTITQQVTASNQQIAAVAGTVAILNEGNQRFAGNINKIQVELEKLTKPDPYAQVKEHTERLSHMPAVTKGLGGMAGGIKNLILLRDSGASDKDIAAESIRLTGSILEVAANVCKIGGPYGKLAGEVLSSLQGLCDLATLIMGLTNPEKKEPSLQEVLTNVIKSDRGFDKRDVLAGIVNELEVVATNLANMKGQQIKNGRQYDSWSAVWSEAEVKGGSGYYSRLGEISSWLKDSKNQVLSPPDPWDDVLYMYIRARDLYFRNHVEALFLTPHPDPANPDYLHGIYTTQTGALGKMLSAEKAFLKDIVPVAVRKSSGLFIGTGACRLWSIPGFRSYGENWPHALFGNGSLYTKIAVGPDRRIWCLANDHSPNSGHFGHIYTLQAKQDGSILADCTLYPPGGYDEIKDPWGAWGFWNLSVAPREGSRSEVHALRFKQDDPGARRAIVYYYAWDEEKVGKGVALTDPKIYGIMAKFGRRYAEAAIDGQSVQFFDVAAAPCGHLYLQDAGLSTQIWRWNDKTLEIVKGTPQWEEFMGTFDMGGVISSRIWLKASSNNLYMYGFQGILYKSFDNLGKDGDNSEWIKIPPPLRAPGDQTIVNGKLEWPKLEGNWCYTCVAESEGGAVLAIITIPNISEGYVYMWADGVWHIGSSGIVATAIVTIPQESHKTLNAYKAYVAEQSQLYRAA